MSHYNPPRRKLKRPPDEKKIFRQRKPIIDGAHGAGKTAALIRPVLKCKQLSERDKNAWFNRMQKRLQRETQKQEKLKRTTLALQEIARKRDLK